MLVTKGEAFEKINNVIPDAIIDLKYATKNNFVGEVVYDDHYDCLRVSTLEKLATAAKILREKHYRMIIWDAYRPLKVQKIFWDIVGDEDFVAPPERGSKHNRGCAVDVTLANMAGEELLMPTHFDDFSEQARSDRKDLPKDIEKRLKDLQEAMIQAGFEYDVNEWWHFVDQDWKKHELI